MKRSPGWSEHAQRRDAEEGRWLLAAERAAVHVHLGYGSFGDDIERLFGYQPRSLQERLRVAEALEGLPALARALSSGELSWSAARELTRVAVQDTEQEWLEFARGKTLRQLEQALVHRRPGDTPASPPDLSARRHTLRFDVAAETLAAFREAMSELRRRAGTPLDDDSALLELARCVLGGPSNEGRASYQLVLHVCPDCGNGRQQATGELVPVGPDVVSMAQCDAQHVAPVAGPTTGPSTAPANDLDLDLDGRGSGSEAATTPVSAQASQDGAHVSASTRRSAGSPSVVPRAKQTIPPGPAPRGNPSRSDRCQVPGCSNARWLDVHHIELRSEGGRHSLQNLVCLCGLCRARHNPERGIMRRASPRGPPGPKRSESGVIRVRHVDGTEYGRPVHPQRLELRAKVSSALRQLGFREAQVRAALEQLQHEPAVADFLRRHAARRVSPALSPGRAALSRLFATPPRPEAGGAVLASAPGSSSQVARRSRHESVVSMRRSAP
jgi:hypothetical protein